MQLQKETKTSKFESEYQQAIVNVLFTYGWCIDNLKKEIEAYDITTQQFNILRILRGQYPNPSTISLLKSRMLDKMCDASRIVDRLVQKGYVLKATSPNDKRAVDILITEKGLTLLKQIGTEVNLWAFVSANLTEEEAIQLNNLLDKMRG